MTLELDTRVRCLAFAPGCVLASNGGLAAFTLSIQQQAIAIQGVALNVGGLDVELALRHVGVAKIERFVPSSMFPDGVTISDMGISGTEYKLTKTLLNGVERHQVPVPSTEDAADPHWFELGGLWYLRAKLLQHVTVHVANPGAAPIEVYGVLLYREIVAG